MTLTYEQSVEAWRRQYEQGLLADEGWFSVVGLHWLTEGENRLGSAATNNIALPVGKAPDTVGTLWLEHDAIRFAAVTEVVVGGKPMQAGTLQLNGTGSSERIEVGSLVLRVIRRSSRYGVRVYDKDAVSRRTFTELAWFPIGAAYCLAADFVPYATPKTAQVLNILGDTQKVTIPGEVVFTLHGQQYRLLPTHARDKLFFVFKDHTSGKQSYPAARFLSADVPVNGRVTLDFNKAHNPPCAYTPYATCPLPIEENHLDTLILAGEKNYLNGKD